MWTRKGGEAVLLKRSAFYVALRDYESVVALFRQREGRFKRQPAELMSNHFSIPPSEAHEVKVRTQFSRRLLRLKPAAEYLSLSPAKLRALIQACEIPVVKYGENAPWLIDVRDLDYWIERSKTNIG
jgi:hypothetical protein